MAYSQSSRFPATPIALPTKHAEKATRLPTLNREPQLQKKNQGEMCEDARRDLAKKIYDSRRARDKCFPAEVFSEPAWDILLILYWAYHSEVRLSVSAVCASSGVPATTALRWIETLATIGFLHKRSHPTDRRVTWLSLTKDSRENLDQYLDGVLDSLREVPGLARTK